MRSLITRVLAVVGVVALLAVSVDYVSYATTGKSLLLGKANSANKTTSIANTGTGPALTLTTKSSASAPFATNAKGKVANLNADRVDGLTATQVIAAAQQPVTEFRDSATTHASDATYVIGKLPRGTYLVSFSGIVRLTQAGTLICQLFENGSIFTDYAAVAEPSTGGLFTVALAHAQVVTLTGTEDMRLGCSTATNDGWVSQAMFFGGRPVTISFLKLDLTAVHGM
jgi:hypothetical protein